MCYSQDNGLLLPKLFWHKKGFIPKMKSGSHTCSSKVVKVCSRKPTYTPNLQDNIYLSEIRVWNYRWTTLYLPLFTYIKNHKEAVCKDVNYNYPLMVFLWYFTFAGPNSSSLQAVLWIEVQVKTFYIESNPLWKTTAIAPGQLPQHKYDDSYIPHIFMMIHFLAAAPVFLICFGACVRYRNNDIYLFWHT